MRRVALLIILAGCSLLGCNPSGPTVKPQVADAMHKSQKRGVAFNFANVEDLPLLSPYICWDYNWGNTANENAALWFDTNEMDYCPMCWNGNYDADKIREYVAAHPKTRYLLAFNEPNLNDQARLTPAEAAAIWQPVVALAKELNLKLVSPAMNYGTLSGYSDPIKWLDEFFEQPEVNLSDIYAISIHCYMSSVGAMQGFVEKFAKYGKPIWLTEFCAWDPVPSSVEVQMSYMCNALNYLEQSESVERYAWFIPRTTGKVDSAPYMQLLTHTDPPELTELGKIYAYFSTFDESVAFNRFVHAGEYISLSSNAVQVRPSTDAEAVRKAGREGLMVTDMSQGQAVSYQIYVPAESKEKALEVRYSSYSNSICEVLIDGELLTHLDMPRTGGIDQWAEVRAGFTGKTGIYMITFNLLSGSCYFSGFQIAGTDD